MLLGDHFTGEFEWITGGLWQAELYEWERILVDGAGTTTPSSARAAPPGSPPCRRPAGHPRHRGSEGPHRAEVHRQRVPRLPRDRYTTLVETDDRILATSVTARWRYLPEAVAAGIDYNAAYDTIGAAMLSAFATTHSLALQQSLYEMGRAGIEACDGVAEIRFAMPSKHHFLSDLSRSASRTRTRCSTPRTAPTA